MAPLLTGCLRLGHKTIDPAQGRVDIHRYQILTILTTKDIGDTLSQTASLQVHQFHTIVMHGKINLRIDEDDTLKGRQDIVEFRGIRFEELPAGRYIEKEVLHLEVTTHRAGRRLLPDHL